MGITIIVASIIATATTHVVIAIMSSTLRPLHLGRPSPHEARAARKVRGSARPPLALGPLLHMLLRPNPAVGLLGLVPPAHQLGHLPCHLRPPIHLPIHARAPCQQRPLGEVILRPLVQAHNVVGAGFELRGMGRGLMRRKM